MLLSLLTPALLLASTAAAMPPSWKRQSTTGSQPALSIDLKNTMLAVVEQLQASMDGTPVPVPSSSNDTTTTATYDEATISCIEVCIPEYHCTLYDQDLAPFASLNPGTSTFDSSRVSQIVCEQGLV